MVSPRPVDQFPSFESKFALGRLFGQEFQPASGQLKEVFHDLVAFNGPRCFAIQVVHQRRPSPVGFVRRECERKRLANLRADHFHWETFHERLIGGEGNLQVGWTGDDETHNVLGVEEALGPSKLDTIARWDQTIGLQIGTPIHPKFHHPVPVLGASGALGKSARSSLIVGTRNRSSHGLRCSVMTGHCTRLRRFPAPRSQILAVSRSTSLT